MSSSNDFRSPEPGLTDAERRQLEELDRSLTADDPALADALIWGVVQPDRPDRVTRAIVCVVVVVLLLFAVTVGGPGAAAATALAVLGAALFGVKLHKQQRTL